MRSTIRCAVCSMCLTLLVSPDWGCIGRARVVSLPGVLFSFFPILNWCLSRAIPQIRLKKSVTEILLRRSCYGDSVTETPTHFNPYRFRQTLSTTHRRLIPCKGYLNTHQTWLPAKSRSQPPRFRSAFQPRQGS